MAFARQSRLAAGLSLDASFLTWPAGIKASGTMMEACSSCG
jgi:hypothetical protein